MADQLVEFLRARKEHAATSDLDWYAKRDRWVASVKSLYEVIKQLFAEALASNDVTVRSFEVQVNEEYVGQYSIPALELKVGNERVEFLPKGITIFGATGRVDLRGDADTVTLLRDTDSVQSEWTVVLQRVPALRTAPLDSESLKYALERVMLPLA